ncbi:hypothetical protein OIU76_024477 [Salix suchowensis]|nr:hypothetical protein OIU76_024477 [Salix suchowensis]
MSGRVGSIYELPRIEVASKELRLLNFSESWSTSLALLHQKLDGLAVGFAPAFSIIALTIPPVTAPSLAGLNSSYLWDTEDEPEMALLKPLKPGGVYMFPEL